MDGSVLSAPYDPSDPQRRSLPRGSKAPATEVLIAPRVTAEEKEPLQSTIPAPAPQAPRLYAAQPATTGPAMTRPKVSDVLRLAFVLRGLAAIGLTIIVFTMTKFLLTRTSLYPILALQATYPLVGGLCTLVAGVKAQMDYKAGLLLLAEGVLKLFAALILFVPMTLGVRFFISVIVVSLLGGLLLIGAALSLRKHLARTWLLALAGVTALLYAWFANAVGQFRAVPAALTIVSGVFWLAFGLSTRSQERRT